MLGASVPNLVVALCKDFLLLVVIAIVLGGPLAYYVMDRFLHQYVFHTEIDAGTVILAVAMLLGIAIITVVYQSSKAAMVNPAKSLRSE